MASDVAIVLVVVVGMVVGVTIVIVGDESSDVIVHAAAVNARIMRALTN
ncbi:MAG: hypothetical protein V3S32_00870 [Acidimicrobiia bacterium]